MIPRKVQLFIYFYLSSSFIYSEENPLRLVLWYSTTYWYNGQKIGTNMEVLILITFSLGRMHYENNAEQFLASIIPIFADFPTPYVNQKLPNWKKKRDHEKFSKKGEISAKNVHFKLFDQRVRRGWICMSFLYPND